MKIKKSIFLLCIIYIINQTRFILVMHSKNLINLIDYTDKYKTLNPENLIEFFGARAIIYAAYFDYKDIVEKLINMKIDVNLKDEYNSTALIYASYHGYKDIVSLLLNVKNIDLDNCNTDGFTALMGACYSGNNDIVRMLIKAGADFKIIDKYDWNAITWAIIRQNKEIIILLLDIYNSVINWNQIIIHINSFANNDIKESIKEIYNNYKKELFKSIQENNLENFKRYIVKAGSICIKDKNNNNVLHYAANLSKPEVIKITLSIKPDLIFQANIFGQTPLDLAISRPEALKVFINLI